MSNDKKGSKYVIPSNEEIKQSIKESVKSKASQKRTTNTNTNASTTKPTEKPATTTKKTTPPTDTSKAKKSPLWNKIPKPVKVVGKSILKGIIPAASNWALDNINDTSSLYYDPNTGMYVDSADMQAIWQKNLANNNWAYNLPYSAFNKLPDSLGEGISDVLRVKDPKARKIVSDITNAVSYAIPYYGVGKGIYDIGDKVSNTIWDTNRDIDMIKDLRYGDLGYSNDYILKNDDKWWSDAANLFTVPMHGIDSLITRFKQDSDWSKLGRQTVTKILQKQLKDTNNFDMEDAAYKGKSLSLKNDFDKFSQLLADEQKYWELVALKDSLNMDDEQFAAHLSNNGIDQNRFNQLEYSAKQIHNLGDNQARNGIEYDPNYKINTWDPKIQLINAQKNRSIVEPSVETVANTEPVLEFMSPNDPGYIKGDPMTFTKEYNKRHGIKDVTDFYDIWK